MMALDTIWGMNSGSSLQHVQTTQQGHVVSLYCLPARHPQAGASKQYVQGEPFTGLEPKQGKRMSPQVRAAQC